MATRLAILVKGKSRTRFLIICFILNRQVFFNDVNWLSDIPNPSSKQLVRDWYSIDFDMVVW